jgi:hypothetical protein
MGMVNLLKSETHRRGAEDAEYYFFSLAGDAAKEKPICRFTNHSFVMRRRQTGFQKSVSPDF